MVGVVIGSWLGAMIMLQVMTPSVATMGPTMNHMGSDMNRGVDSFTSPGTYMWNMMR
ncbi:MAG: hypothetical protein P8163_17680 [Candidatus Thiodiazotropha sp.]